jgi:hypothetical protein
MKHKMRKKINKPKKVKKKISASQGDEIEKNQDYRSNNKIKNKLKFDKYAKNKNLKPKHRGPKPKIPSNIKMGQIENFQVHKFTKESKTKIKIKRVKTILGKKKN